MIHKWHRPSGKNSGLSELVINKLIFSNAKKEGSTYKKPVLKLLCLHTTYALKLEFTVYTHSHTQTDMMNTQTNTTTVYIVQALETTTTTTHETTMMDQVLYMKLAFILFVTKLLDILCEKQKMKEKTSLSLFRDFIQNFFNSWFFVDRGKFKRNLQCEENI